MTQENNQHKTDKQSRESGIESSLDDKWPIDKYWPPSNKFYNPNLISLKKDKITNNHIDDCKNRKSKKPEKKIYSILKRQQQSHNKINTIILTLIIKKLLIHIPCVILEDSLVRRDKRIELLIRREMDIAHTNTIGKWILIRSLDKGCEIRIASLQYLKCTLLRNVLYRHSGKSRLKLRDKFIRLDLPRAKSITKIHRDCDTIVHTLDKSLTRKE